jgi:hypothetical protein
MEEAALQQERVFSIITLKHASSAAAALRQKLVQFATLLHLLVLHILQHKQPIILGFRAFLLASAIVV